MTKHPFFRNHRRQQGFTLIEVMIAVLVMGLGLLGFAMLQTMSVRYTKSAQNRTVAINLAYELLDMMRMQRTQASYYSAIKTSSFASATGGNCTRPQDATPANNITRWKCELRTAFPDGTGNVDLQADGRVSVRVEWTDAYWESAAAQQKTSVQVQSRI